MTIRKRFVQLLNPVTQHYVKVDTLKGRIVAHKRTKGPYKHVTIIKEDRREDFGVSEYIEKVT